MCYPLETCFACAQVVFGAIRRNKHVITANKALVATCLGEIQELLKEHPGVTFGFEAAVCGGEHCASVEY